MKEPCRFPWWQWWKYIFSAPHDYGEVMWDGPGKTIPGGGGVQYRICKRCGKYLHICYFNS